jgi:hypothetical protein
LYLHHSDGIKGLRNGRPVSKKSDYWKSQAEEKMFKSYAKIKKALKNKPK